MTSRLHLSGLSTYEIQSGVDEPTHCLGMSRIAEAMLDPEGRQILGNTLPYYTEGKTLPLSHENHQLEAVVMPLFAHKMRLAAARAISDITAGASYQSESHRPENHFLRYLAQTYPVILEYSEAEKLSGITSIYYPGFSFSPEEIMHYLCDHVNRQARIFNSTEGLLALMGTRAVHLVFRPLPEPRD